MDPRLLSKAAVVLVAAGLALGACTDGANSNSANSNSAGSGAGSGAGQGGEAQASGQGSLPTPLVLDVPDPASVYDPVLADEVLPEGYRQLLGRDDIAPVYDPSFVNADGVGWPDESLVIGVDIDGEARAYPVGFLNRREIVNDRHQGIPTLVTW